MIFGSELPVVDGDPEALTLCPSGEVEREVALRGAAVAEQDHGVPSEKRQAVDDVALVRCWPGYIPKHDERGALTLGRDDAQRPAPRAGR